MPPSGVFERQLWLSQTRHWITSDTSGFNERYKWHVGDFNADGRSDLAWTDSGYMDSDQNYFAPRIATFLSNGAAFAPRGGNGTDYQSLYHHTIPFGNYTIRSNYSYTPGNVSNGTHYWLPGDFSGDGRTDFALVFSGFENPQPDYSRRDPTVHAVSR